MLAPLLDGLLAGASFAADALYEAAALLYDRVYRLDRYLHGRPY